MMHWKCFACLFFLIFSHSYSYQRFLTATRRQRSSFTGTHLHAIETYRTDASDGSVSKVLSSFYRMVDRFKDYTSEDIDAVESERLRLLLEGGQEALTEPSVVGSFAVLYEDVLPVRFGGDILFNLIDKTIKQSRNKGKQSTPKQQPSNEKIEVTKMSKSIIQSMLAFYQANDPSGANEKNDEGGYWFCEDRLFAEIDRNGDGVLTFEEFRDWVSSVPLSAEEMGLPSKSDVTETWSYMENIFSLIDVNNDGTLTPGDTHPFPSFSPLHQTLSHPLLPAHPEEFRLWTTGSLSQSDDECALEDTTLHMVHSFTLWEDKFKGLSGDTGSSSKSNSKARLTLIINGCFAGAKNPGECILLTPYVTYAYFIPHTPTPTLTYMLLHIY